MQEKYLCDEYGEPIATTISLEDITQFVKEFFGNEYKVEAIREDYDDYGSETYIKITGACASLILDFFAGNGFSTRAALDCKVSLPRYQQDFTNPVLYDYSRDENGKREAYNEFYFAFKDDLKEYVRNELTIAADYKNQLTKWFNENRKYLNADTDLFVRIDRIKTALTKNDANYNANSGCNYSEHSYLVSDADFYTDTEINHNAQRTILATKRVSITS